MKKIIGFVVIPFSLVVMTYLVFSTMQAQSFIAESEKPSVSQLEMLIEQKTQERMKDPAFIADAHKRARIDIIQAINTKTSTELHDYLDQLNKEIKGLK